MVVGSIFEALRAREESSNECSPSKLRPGCLARHFCTLHVARIASTMTTTVASAAADNKPPKKSGYDVPWVEKYRPETLEDVVGNEDTLVRLRAISKDGNMPNLILCGPPGTGKVSIIAPFSRHGRIYASHSFPVLLFSDN